MRNHAKCFLGIIGLNPSKHPMSWVLLSSFYRPGDYGSERSKDLPVFAQPEGGAGLQPRMVQLLTPSKSLSYHPMLGFGPLLSSRSLPY